MLDTYVNNITTTKTNKAMFSSESTCNPHKNTLPGERYKYKPKTFSHTHHTPTGTKDKTVLYFELVILIGTEFISIQHLS